MIQLPPRPQFRHFRFRLSNGRFVKVKDKIRSPRDYTYWHNKLNPVDSYMTVSEWLSPELLESRKHCKAVFLRSDFLIDIDRKELAWTEVISSLLRLLRELRALDYREFRILRSNGYHIWILDWDKAFRPPSNPAARENYYRQKAIKLTNYLKKKGHYFDYNISKNPRQVARVWNSHHRLGFQTRLLKNTIFKYLNNTV